ncbi:flavodoxin family protein [Pseudomonas syringae]|uniref:NAD(P)H-dependent oxidoreductase n=1 Tax=Pseudomonas syringae TaxID=317 RepID=UPI001F27D6A3|nr:NAD(P)H-dependent oxidoreductase [Pseudomonas syringae]MCF5707581.1 flavodoxin family protein [Pseudomonas syringae]
MHALIIVAHYDPRSLTQSVAHQVAAGISQTGTGNSAGIVDLVAEGFNPVFNAADHDVHRQKAGPPADILAEHARIEGADALVLVYPIYWWSMPALMKGWIDRVFVNGWAFDFSPNEGLVKKLGHMKIHLVGVGGADAGTYQRHGYEQAIKTQIDHGIFGYCGAPVMQSALLLDSETADPAVTLARAFELGCGVFSQV